MTDTTRPDGVAEIVRRLQACADDPMWADHAEISKALLRAAIAALTAPASKPAAVTDKVIADAIPVTATMLTTGPRNKVCMTRSELHQFAAALSHAKPAAGGVVDERTAFEAWAERTGRHLHKVTPCDGSKPQYLDACAPMAWEAWQARAAQHPSQSAGEPVGTLNVSRFRGHLENHSFDYTGTLSDGTYPLYVSPPPTDAARASGVTDEHLIRLADMLWEQGHISSLSRDTATIYGRAVLSLQAGAPVGQAVDYPHEHMDAVALDRFKVVPAHDSMFWTHAVVAGDGKQQLYTGREVECQNMARKFAGAFLDGAFFAHEHGLATPAEPDAARVEADRDAATRIAARALSDRVAEMCNVDKEDHWKYHYDDVISDTELVISTYLSALAAERKEQA